MKIASALKILIIGLICAAAYAIYLSFGPSEKTDGTAAAEQLKIGVAAYKEDDTYISTILTALDLRAKEYELLNGVHIRLDIADAKENQITQNAQIDRFIDLNFDALCVNMVDRTEAAPIIDKAREAGIPVIFFNREPVKEDLFQWEKAFYVGFDARLSAKYQARIILDRYKEDPAAIDKNGDGVIQYAMFEGEIRHQDSLIRTEKSIQYLTEGGLAMEKVGGGRADWKREQAMAIMENLLGETFPSIELIICNNDDMALGVIDALKAAGAEFNNIVGIDATPSGREAVKNGEMLGTVNTDAAKCADVIFRIIISQANKNLPPENVVLIDNKYAWVEQNPVFE